ncbi:hypothetical protein [Streptomyces phytohabitans]|uniref:hypothetical protein n=1 Tax=Streptomyces phytohabitans TaxID=1150371 RepID=UPI00345C4896
MQQSSVREQPEREPSARATDPSATLPSASAPYAARPGRRRRLATAVVAVAVLGLFGTACSGGDDDGDEGGGKDTKGSSSTRDGGGSDEDQAVAWRKCLRDNGVDMPEPKPGSNAAPGLEMTKENQAATEKAFEACKDEAPKNGPGSEMTQEKKDALIEYATCMREQGVDMPIPKEGEAMALPAPSTPAEKKAYEKAGKACEDVRL